MNIRSRTAAALSQGKVFTLIFILFYLKSSFGMVTRPSYCEDLAERTAYCIAMPTPASTDFRFIFVARWSRQQLRHLAPAHAIKHGGIGIRRHATSHRCSTKHWGSLFRLFRLDKASRY